MGRKIKILHIQETIGSGGVERRRLSMAKHLDKFIFDQKFICTYAYGNIPDEISAEGYEVLPIGQLKSPLHWSQHRKVQKIIQEYQPDIIHGAVFEGVTLAAINGWLKKVPVVIIEETSFPVNRTWKGNLLMKLFSMISHKVIGVSQAATDEYLKGELKLSDKKVILVNNGVAQPRQVSEVELHEEKKRWGIEDYDFVIGSIGRMVSDANKRFSDLIRAFADFARNKKDVKLLLIGEGPKKFGYEKLVKDLGICNKVIFTGYQSDVSLFYQMMDVFALVSRNESFGLVLAEAMLNKLPVIATKVGGMKYIVEDRKTGFLVPVYDVQQIAEKLEVLFADKTTRLKMGRYGYEKALKEFTEERYVKIISNLYKQLNNTNQL